MCVWLASERVHWFVLSWIVLQHTRVRLHVCMYVCMYVCVFSRVYVYILSNTHIYTYHAPRNAMESRRFTSLTTIYVCIHVPIYTCSHVSRTAKANEGPPLHVPARGAACPTKRVWNHSSLLRIRANHKYVYIAWERACWRIKAWTESQLRKYP
jgi:hypothetical protein